MQNIVNNTSFIRIGIDLDFTFNLGGTHDYKVDIEGDDLEFKDLGQKQFHG